MTNTPALSPATPPSPFLVFRHRNFSLMWVGQLVSTIGSALTSLAASILVFNQTGGSALSVGLMLMATAGPSLLVGLVAGVFVDRFDRRRIMLIADLLRAVLVFLIPFLVPFGIVWLYLIVMLSSAIGQFFDPAYESILPEAAPDEELAAANSLIAISSFGSTAVGFAAAGLIAKFDIAYAFYIDAATFLVSAGCVLLLRVRKVEVTEETSVKVVVANLKSGLSYLTKNPVLRSILMLAIPIAISFGLGNSLLLPFATKALHADTVAYGIQEGLTSVGFVAASLLLAVFMNRWREGQWMTVSLIGMGLAALVYSQMHSVALAIGVQTLSGFMNAPYSIARRLLVQRNTVAEMRGRVSSAFFVASNAFFLIGMAAAGLADILDVRLLYLLGSGVLTLACGLLSSALPGIGQPAAEWRKALQLLRSAPSAAAAGTRRAVLPADMDRLVGLVPSLAGLARQERERIITQGSVLMVPSGTRLMKSGEVGEEAYFVLSGKAVAGSADENGNYRALSSMGPGDYFGEIAALAGAQRTADVVAEEQTELLMVNAPLLRQMMAQPAFSRMVLARMSERLARTSIRDLPRTVGISPQDALELRHEPAREIELEASGA